MSEHYYPGMSEDAVEVELPITKVTLLEDRAQVRRAGKLQAKPGANRFRVPQVAPTAQDLSLSAQIEGAGRVADLRVRRALRQRGAESPGEAKQLEDEARSIARNFVTMSEDRAHAERRFHVMADMLYKAVGEVPTDAAWGQVNTQVWQDNLDTLFQRLRALRGESLELSFQQRDLQDALSNLAARRQALDRPDVDFVAWFELDIVADSDGELEIVLEYTVPNALWRPVHAAHLRKGEDGARSLKFVSSASVWQNTGEDWSEVELAFSTARSSLGIEPPLLNDDLLSAQRKTEQLRVEARRVKVQRAGVDSGAAEPASRAVELPGVDDGGEIRNLSAQGKVSVPSDGRPNTVPLFEFNAQADSKLISMPELEQKAFLKTVQKNEASSPILAGPVELIQDGGFVGWTEALFVAPKETFELSFGPDDGLRVQRIERNATETASVSRWKVSVNLATIYLSNLSGAPKQVEVKERIPVSEVEQVQVTLLNDQTTGKPQVDDNGICTFAVELAPHERQQLRLAWSLASAPEVQGA